MTNWNTNPKLREIIKKSTNRKINLKKQDDLPIKDIYRHSLLEMNILKIKSFIR